MSSKRTGGDVSLYLNHEIQAYLKIKARKEKRSKSYIANQMLRAQMEADEKQSLTEESNE